MSQAIWKFPLKPEDRQTIAMPAGARILSLQVQSGTPCIWALVDPKKPEVQHHEIVMHGTGHTFEGDPGAFLGTIQMFNGSLVLHVFEKAP